MAVSDEVFVDLTSGRLTRNRLPAGPMIAVADHVDISVDYLNERDVGAFVDVTVRL
jgi:hypothetical protein